MKKFTAELNGLKENGNEDRPEVIKSACVDHATNNSVVQIAFILCWSATDFYIDLLFRGKGTERQRFEVSRYRLAFYLIS